jgi:hypothetical protein
MFSLQRRKDTTRKSQRRPLPKPSVEALEDRCVPSTISLNFNSLPSAQGWTYRSGYQPNSPLETNVFSIDGTKLTQNTMGIGSNFATYERSDLCPTRPFTIAVRAQVLASETTAPGAPATAFIVYAVAGSEIFGFGLNTTTMDAPFGGTNFLPIDATQLHDYTIEAVPGVSESIFVDGELVFDGMPPQGSYGPNLIGLGNASSFENGLAEVTSYTFSQGLSLTPISDQTVDEGSLVRVLAFATDPDPSAVLAYSLDSAPPGATIDPNTGVFTFTPTDGPATYPVTVRVSDNGTPALSDTTSFNITVNNVAPTASLTGPTDGFQGVRGQPRTFTLSATDISPVDQAAGFTYAVNWGDGTSETDSGLSGTQVSHIYSTAGAYTVTMTATDKDGGTSTPVTLPVTIHTVEQQGAILAVGGTPNADTFLFTPGSVNGTVKVAVDGALQGTFATGQVVAYGAAGNDTVSIQGAGSADAFAINSTNVAVRGVTIAADHVETWNVNGGAGNDTFAINGSGLAASLSGGANNDQFILSPGVVFDGTIDGSTGVDTVVGGNMSNSWILAGSNAGTLNGSAFTGIENLTGGSGQDTFHFQPGGGVTGLINGGAGIDTLDYSTYGSPVTLDLRSKTGTGLDNFANVEAFVGSAAMDTINGPDTATTWQITNTNAGKVGTFSFSSFENLVGGSASDVFKFNNGKGISGAIDGGGGGDALNYAAYTTPVMVDLALGTATGVAGGASEIQIVIGGSANDILTGDAGNSILVGGAGNDTLTAGTGRAILIGGVGSDTLTGGPADDILLGGTTSYDLNPTALLAIMKEWQRTDETYQQRIDHLGGTTLGGLNGTFNLKATTVHDDASADTLTGGLGMDWFWASLSQDHLTDMLPGELVN